MRKTRKPVALGLALALVAALGVGGTIAWLTDKTETVQNTFTAGDVDIELTETGATDGNEDSIFEKSYKMVPGDTLAKDPTITVAADSEECWLFVKVTESSTLASYISYEMAEGWTAINDGDGSDLTKVYYRDAAGEAKAGDTFGVLKSNQVKVIETVTKADMDALSIQGAVQPTLTFTAYAVQKANVDTVSDAWSVATTGAKPSQG